MSAAGAFCIAIDSITSSIFLKEHDYIVSKNGDFKLGFFSPSNSTNRYIGIWFNKVLTNDVFWVANRNNPLNDSSGVMKVSADGNLQVLNGRNDVLWSSNMSVVTAANASLSAQLLDTGNLVLFVYYSRNNTSGNGTMVWQSFGHPTDSLMPNTKLIISNSNMNHALQPWKSPSDPSYGRFSVGTDSFIHSQVVIWDGDRPHWRSGPWNGNIFLGLMYTDEATNYANTYIRQNDKDGTVDFVYTGASTLAYSHYAFSYDGTISEKWWDGKKWQYVWGAPVTECDLYGSCGAFGSCNPTISPVCRCLKGFRPKNPGEWKKGNWSNGCVRKVSLQCGIQGGKDDGFFSVKNVKVPDHTEWSVGLNQVNCRSQCLQNCSCLAYAYDAGAGCMYWSRDLIDIQEFSSGGLDLYLRLPHSELVQRKNEQLENLKHDENGHQVQLKELPLFEFKRLATATNDFQDSNKLGQGGFGPVYKGTLEDGVQIAVKRLSAASGQGLEEFMNEVVVISKLQHRNLVKLLGCCIENQEKMLIYEYMPNKSLDFFLFDPVKRELLNWEKRFTIIEGISRGLVYLHRDSRLRIIHRDLKASNILLDEDLIPKISDFGMARIFGNKQDQDNTRRVVGTYGYMSPEYAMEGHFSEKSDVYSFGVLLLEIMTGKKNNNFWLDEQSLTLLGYVWKLWNEDDLQSVIDPLIADPTFSPEILRCIHVGLLCVQEYPGDRPSTSTLLSMIVSDIVDLPCPKQPGFVRRLVSSDTDSSQLHGQKSSSSSNYVSITPLSGR
uniref:Receptor-like serine/threonine-protein kinase n=1 Tax=Chenopodium quinoa TaxID=63459 RepID=A0A803MXA9_CHEQI